MPPNNSLRWHTIGLTLPNSLKFAALPNALQACTHTPYKHSRHECLIAFYTWGLDLIGFIHPPLNECIRVFAALSNSLSGWKQFHSIKAMAMVITKLIKKHLIRCFDISLISNNNTSPLCQFSEASPIKCLKANELSYYPSMVMPLVGKFRPRLIELTSFKFKLLIKFIM